MNTNTKNVKKSDKAVMEELLLLEKGACDLYMHGAIESSDERVFSSFSSALHQSLQMQNQIYTAMKERGWYSPADAERQSIISLKQKYSQN